MKMENMKKLGLNKVWIAIAALFICFLISWSVMGPVIDNNYMVQDDFRQSCFWFWQFWDPDLFKNSFFVEMYKSLTIRSPFFFLIYKSAPLFTENLLVYTKTLVFIIGMLSSLSAFLFFKSLLKNLGNFQIPDNLRFIWSSAFSIAVTTLIWCTDHVTVGHSRSFLWFGLFLFMYFKLEKMDLTANFFCIFLLMTSPHAFILCYGLEGLSQLFKHKLDYFNFSKAFQRPDFLIWIFNGLLTGFMFLYLFKDIQTQGVGTPFTVPEMKALPEFNPGGRHPIFGSNIWDGSWWTNEHWGLGIGYLKVSELILWAFPTSIAFMLLSFFKSSSKAAVKKRPLMTDFAGVFSSVPMRLLYSSIVLYFLSQIVFPKLYLPSRYIALPWLLLAIVALFLIGGIWLIQIFEEFSKAKVAKKLITIPAILLTVSSLFFWSYYKSHYHTRFVKMSPQVAELIKKLNKDAVIAGHPLLPDLNAATAITKRAIFVDYERSMAYTHESLKEIRRRNEVALKLTYAGSREEFKKLAQENGITHYLAYFGFYIPSYLNNPVYLNPYGDLLRKLTSPERRAAKYFIGNYLEESGQQYTLISVNAL